LEGIFWAEDLLPDPERFLVERLGFGVVPDLFEKEPEVIQGSGGLRMLRHYASPVSDQSRT
jgi:hypothetical protein